jgi:hypothetical protein
LFTYLIPIIPILVCWDGIVSVLRTYTLKELNQMIRELNNYEDYIWKIDKIKSGPSMVTYLLAYKKH